MLTIEVTQELGGGGGGGVKVSFERRMSYTSNARHLAKELSLPLV